MPLFAVALMIVIDKSKLLNLEDPWDEVRQRTHRTQVTHAAQTAHHARYARHAPWIGWDCDVNNVALLTSGTDSVRDSEHFEG